MLAALVPGAVWGDLFVARGMMAPALADLGGQERSSLVLTGTETVGSTVTALSSEVAVHRYQEPDLSYRYYLEYRSFRDGTLVKRVVADGTRVWTYDAGRHEYSVWQYDLEAGDRNRVADRAALNMMRTVRRQATGPDDLLMQLTVEAYEAQANYSALVSKWHPWMTNATVTLAGAGFFARTSSPRVTEMFYEISNPSPTEFYFTALRMGRIEQREGTGWKVTEFEVAVNRGAYSATANFGFSPGTAKPVAVGLPQRGGG